ncbi:molybdopterin synthase catalytic subunit-like [Hydra vulgaris]|uniref:Molybdopterin synthase catalytic subunit-like n=1 Tax=Hydra vulgaris TaxID=6087 RepID=A0ABM4D0K6_HYDVU
MFKTYFNEFMLTLTKEKLDVETALKFVVLPTTGGTSIFVGTTRNNFQNRNVVTLFYEAYEPMAKSEMLKISLEAQKKFNVARICIMHRLGEVPIAESSIIIACSSEHRSNAINAVEFLINELKSKVPIWKKEIYAEGDFTWKENPEIFWKC